jgi:hypothetical protein
MVREQKYSPLKMGMTWSCARLSKVKKRELVASTLKRYWSRAVG